MWWESIDVTFLWQCFASEGPRLPLWWAHFHGFLMHLALALLAFCLNSFKLENAIFIIYYTLLIKLNGRE